MKKNILQFSVEIIYNTMGMGSFKSSGFLVLDHLNIQAPAATRPLVGSLRNAMFKINMIK